LKYLEDFTVHEVAMLSVVVPVLNEAESLPQLYQELIDVAREHGYERDLIFVDDGSTDGSWDVIERLAGDDSSVQGIRFRRNFGKAAALSAGFAAARGDLVVTLDADLQDDPREIPRFLAEIEKGVDVVSGWKQVRLDPWHKVGPSRVFNWLVGYLTGVKLHDHNCGFKCYRREIFSEVRLYGELHRFVPVLAAARGWKVGEIPVNHRSRKYGQSKYGMRRFVKGFLDLLTVYFLTGFAQRPAHLLGTFGLGSLMFGIVGLLYLTGYWLVRGYWLLTVPDEVTMAPLHDRPLLLYSVAALLLGVQLLSVGFIAELITAFQGQGTPSYSVRQRVGGLATRPRQDDAA
jgi:dolichol-phosphate mannosyltransferase